MLADLPSVDRLARSLDPSLAGPLRVEIARHAIDRARRGIEAGESLDAVTLAEAEAHTVAARRLRILVNATGVLLHTNLGRAPLHVEAAKAMESAARGYSNLEFDLTTGRRGGRGRYVSELVSAMTGAERTLLVNNNAAALFLVLVAIGKGGRVPVSRGELIEIGGSYRLPDLMAASGVDLVEVGTTNRTRLADFEAVDEPALLLRVHPSNYRIEGFVEEVPLTEMARLSQRTRTPLVFDIGSGLLDRNTPWIDGPPPAWLEGEPDVTHSLAAGAHVVTFSGDKLLGGPQAGLIAGSASLIDACAAHPIARAIRLDGPRNAALAVTLEFYATGRAAELPFWRMALAPEDELVARLERIRTHAVQPASIEPGESHLGAGSVPGRTVPTPVLAIDTAPDEGWWKLLDAGVVATRREGRLVIDVRTVPAEADDTIARALGVL